MRNTNVVHLSQARDLLAVWESARSKLLTGGSSGFYLVLVGPDGSETVYTGGVFQDNPEAAVHAALKTSTIRMLAEDKPLKAVKKASKKI